MSTNTISAGSFFRLSAMRTRKLASDRQKEKNFMGEPRRTVSCPGKSAKRVFALDDPGIHHLRRTLFKMDHRVKPGDDNCITPRPPSSDRPDAPRRCSRADATSRHWREPRPLGGAPGARGHPSRGDKSAPRRPPPRLAPSPPPRER